jgi:hypothetical protein
MKGGEFFFAPSLAFLKDLKKKDEDWEILRVISEVIRSCVQT